MSKRAVIWIIASLFLTGLVLVNFERILPLISFRNPVFTEVIPSKRPPRLDRRMIERYTGMKVDEVISALLSERAANPETVPAPLPPSQVELLLGSLPDAPLPFPETAAPSDEEWLRQFVTTIQNKSTGTPSPDEIWQFNLALSALDVDVTQIPGSLRRNVSPPPESDTFAVRLANKETGMKAPYCTGDFNGDGTIEFVCDGGTKAFHLDDSGNLCEIQWPAFAHPGNGLYPADYDADGDLDLLVTRKDGLPNTLLRNLGNGRFDDVTSDLGLLSFNTTNFAAWLDFNGDGHLDLLVGSEDHPLELYRQNNLASFEPVAWDLKLWIPRGTRQIEVVDINEDLVPDFYLSIEGLANRLYVGQASANAAEWRFNDITPGIGLTDSSAAAPGHFFDFDNDGLLDFITVAGGRLQLLHNKGKGQMTNVTEELELPELPATSIGAFDVDNDGYEDLFIGTPNLKTNRVLWNREGTNFRDISVTSLGSFLDSPVRIESSDYDANGHADLLYETESGSVRWLYTTGPVGRWIHITLDGSHLEGTRITAVPRDNDWILKQIPRTVRREFSLTIGLGEAKTIETLSILNPDGSQAAIPLSGLQPDQRIVVKIP